MELTPTRPRFCLHVFGSSGCGKKTFRSHWLQSSHTEPLGDIADVEILVEKSGVDLEAWQLPSTEDTTEHAFLIIYRPDNQESTKYTLQCLQKLSSYYSDIISPRVSVLENHFDITYSPPTSEPSPLPPSLAEGVQVACKFWSVKLQSGLDQCVLHHVVISPAIDLLEEEKRLQLIARACSCGQLPTLQLLSGQVVEDSDTVTWLTTVMSSLHEQPPDSHLTTNLLRVADYLYNLSPAIFLSTVVRMTKIHPQVTLDLLNRFRPQGNSDEHFVKSGLALFSIPISWFQNGTFTHIDLSNNLLLEAAEELFKLSTLRGLNLSHNCLGSIPNILKWNCPRLQELNLSFNRLVDTKYCILNQPRRSRVEPGMSQAGSPGRADQQAHFDEARRLYNLTGYNLYPCVHSLSCVILSNNASLTQIPEWVCLLPNLSLLEIRNVPRLTSLTPYLAHCRSLCLLKLDVERLVSPPAREVAGSGTRGIMAYLRCQLRGSSPYRHLKIVLLGARGVGKTTLFSQLARLKSFSLTAPSHTTHSHMELATLEFRGNSSGREDGKKPSRFRPKITFHLIDFASEEVFQSFHQCFLTHRTLFLCLWDTARGPESLSSLGPWLRGIQASAPGSSVVIIGSHIDQRPALSRSTIAQWEREVFGDASGGRESAYSRNSGLPVVTDSIVMNCQNKKDAEKLMENIYRFALRLKHPRTQTCLVEEMVPRSYQELQTLVEVKLRGLQRKGTQHIPVLKREEFLDHVRSLTLHQDNLEEDEEEFSLAIRFLHEAGTIIYYKPRVSGVSELFFLNPQWLFNTLATILTHLKLYSQNSVVAHTSLPLVLQKSGIPQPYFTHFLGLLEENSALVPLDMDKGHFLIPSLLSTSPPANYPSYDFSSGGQEYLMQYVHLDQLPSSFYPRLLAQVLSCLTLLSGQLLALEGTPLISHSHLQEMKQQARKTCVTRHNLRLDGLGYIQEDEAVNGAATEKRLREKILALSTTNLASLASGRHRTIIKKLATLSGPVQRGGRDETHTLNESRESGEEREGEGEEREDEEGGETDAKESLNPLELAARAVWMKGLHVEFPCGTCLWLEACEGAIAMVAKGAAVQRVKVISFLSACVDMLTEELYAGVSCVHYSPCPSCLSRYWLDSQSDSGIRTREMLGGNFTFAESDFEVSTSLTLNEFKETASFTPVSSNEHSNKSRSFSGSSLTLERSPSPADHTEQAFTSINALGEIIEEMPCVLLDKSIVLYSLSSLVGKAATGRRVRCSKCNRVVSLKEIGPHVLLTDFSNQLLLDPRGLLCGQGESCVLGEGGFGKVVKGSYRGHAVAVKLFRQLHGTESAAKQFKCLREEVNILSLLDHPRVVKLVGVCLSPLSLVMELAPQGSLAHHLDLCPLGLSHTMAHLALHQIADGISYLHSLYIIHRDIKPGNILVWSLDPDRGVDVRLADYGVSQVSTPSGLWRQRGTEEYMAPELRDSHNTAYDEKVDIFSFGLLLHLVVTGRRLFAGVVSRRDQLNMLHTSPLPLLSHALSKSIDENRPQTSSSSVRHVFEETSGRHPAARKSIDASCHSTCMQSIMEHCLARNPGNRPSARGVAGRLLVCPGGLHQARFFTSAAGSVSWAGFSPRENHIVAMAMVSIDDGNDPAGGFDGEATLVIPGAWLYRQKPLPYEGQRITCCAIVGSEVFMGSAASNLILSAKLPSLTSGHISPMLLPGAPLCIIPQETSQGSKVVVGMSAARIAVFSPPGQGRHLLETHPYITQVLAGVGPDKTKISCGLHLGAAVWCGCGGYLLGLNAKDYSLRCYKPLLREEVGEACWVSRMACALGQLWVAFSNRAELAVFDTAREVQSTPPINCHLILGGSCSSREAAVTDLVSSGEAIWAATEGGHVVTFDPTSTNVLLVHRRYSHVSSLVCLGAQRVVVFGRERVEGVDGEEDEEKQMFAVWDSYIKYSVT